VVLAALLAGFKCDALPLGLLLGCGIRSYHGVGCDQWLNGTDAEFYGFLHDQLHITAFGD
jgi:hypothetical protein